MTKLPEYICFRTILLNDLKVRLERVEPEEVAEALRPVRRGKVEEFVQWMECVLFGLWGRPTG